MHYSMVMAIATDEPESTQIYAFLNEDEKRRIKAAAAIRGVKAQEWNREALLEKLAREEKR